MGNQKRLIFNRLNVLKDMLNEEERPEQYRILLFNLENSAYKKDRKEFLLRLNELKELVLHEEDYKKIWFEVEELEKGISLI